MSYDNPEYDLLAAFKARFGLSDASAADPSEAPDTKVLSSAEHIYDNAIDVSISMGGTKAAARSIHALMRDRAYSSQNWRDHELHPDPAVMGDEATVNFIFTMDLLNFSFWSAGDVKYTVEYNGKQWTGYYSLVAALRRALDEDIAITTSDFWQNEEECTEDVLRHVFRSSTPQDMPLFEERVRCLRQAGSILYEHYECSPMKLIRDAQNSARRLVHTLTASKQPLAPLFSDTARFPPDSSHVVHFHKRAQILVADLWACFGGEEGSPGQFSDIDRLTMFPDYRVPQMLSALGVLGYSPRLASRIARGEELESGSVLEVEVRGSAVWAVELLRREIVSLQKQHHHTEVTVTELQDQTSKVVDGEETAIDPTKPKPKPKTDAKVNAVLIDFFLYDLCKEKEKTSEFDDVLPHHRTRSIWY